MSEAHGLSLWELFLQADWIVKSVMILLAAASVACWTIIAEKLWRFRILTRTARDLEEASENPAGALDRQASPVAGIILAAARREVFDRSDDPESRSEYRERLERAMRAAMAGELRQFEGGLPFLATVGSTAPFVGLFGTVWGIMNSFSAIAVANNTSLAVVAPGIAEALFATAIGLFAAIPAVVGYNKLVVDLGRAGQRMGGAIGELGARLSRRAVWRPKDTMGPAVVEAAR